MRWIIYIAPFYYALLGCGLFVVMCIGELRA